jgi:hypothetical protein
MYAVRDQLVHSVMLKETELLYVNIGYEDFVKREMTVNFYMSMI